MRVLRLVQSRTETRLLALLNQSQITNAMLRNARSYDGKQDGTPHHLTQQFQNLDPSGGG